MRTYKHRSRFPIVVSLLCIFLVTTLSLLAWRVMKTMPPIPTGLHTSGNKLVNMQNEIIVPRGINRSGSEYMCTHNAGVFDGPSNAASVDAMAEWKINTVRIPLNEHCWLGINGAPEAFSGLKYRKAIIDYVHLLNAKNLMVVLDLHWSAPGTTLATKQLAMPDLDHSPEFWSSVATSFKNNSSVIFDLFNEPFPKTWDCWLKGSTGPSTAPCADVPFAVAGMQHLVDSIRATGAKNVIITGGLGYASYLIDWQNYKPQDSAHNLIAALHLYNFTHCSDIACLDRTLKPILTDTPVIVGEMGEDDCQHGFIDSMMKRLDQLQVGYLGWAWTVSDCGHFPSLIRDYKGTPTDFGVGFKQHLMEVASTGSERIKNV